MKKLTKPVKCSTLKVRNKIRIFGILTKMSLNSQVSSMLDRMAKLDHLKELAIRWMRADLKETRAYHMRHQNN